MLPIKENVPLAPLTSLNIGGPARFFAPVQSLDQLREALVFARRRGLPFRAIGGGTNLLVSDDGFDGLVLKLELTGVRRTEEMVEAEAGVDLLGLVRRTAGWGLSGMEPLAGIPGLVGGAVRGNAGAYGGSLSELTREVRALDAETLELVTFKRKECRFSYRNSLFKEEPRLVVVAVSLCLCDGDRDEIGARAEATVAKREARGLQCSLSVGSFFMNPVVEDRELIERFETEQRTRCRDGRIPAGWLIDRAGLRNTRVGGALVSPLHANYLVNEGSASAGEMLRLAALVKERVLAATGVNLKEEVSYLGASKP